MADPTDEQIRAEVQAMLDQGSPEQVETGRRDVPAAPAETPSAGVAAAKATADAAAAAGAVNTPTEFQLDERTQRNIAAARKAQQEAAAERQRLAAERQQDQAAKDAAKRLADLERLAKSGRVGALVRALGAAPAKDHAEDMYAEALGDDAPGELKTRSRLAQMERRYEELEQRLEQREREYQEREERAAQERQVTQQREYVRSTLIPQFGDRAAILRAIASDPEFSEGVINTGIQQFHSMTAEQGEVDPYDAFSQVDQRLERMVLRIMSDEIAAARIAKAIEAKKPKPTPTAEKQQPAPTLSNKQLATTTTPPAGAEDWAAYEARVRKEVEDLLKGTPQ